MCTCALQILLVSVTAGAVGVQSAVSWLWCVVNPGSGAVCSEQGCVSADARHPPEVLLGHDLCLRSLRQLRGLRGLGQHLLHLQPENQGGQRPGQPGAAGAHRSALLLLPLLLLLQGKQTVLPGAGQCLCCLWTGCCSCVLTFSHYSWVRTLHSCFVFRILVLLSLPR